MQRLALPSIVTAILVCLLSGCAESATPANASKKATEPTLTDSPPAEGSCAGWQKSLTRGRRADDVQYCLHTKAREDRDAAIAEARLMVDWEIKDNDYSELLPLLAALTKYPKPGSLETYLRELELLPNKPDESTRLDTAITVSDYVSELGNIHWFDAETGTFPNNHDYLLHEVAALSQLKDARFSETAPSDYNADDEPYQLSAEINGKTYQQTAENYGDWYDIGAVIALLNKVAVDQNIGSRFTLLPTQDQTAIIWVVDAQSLHTLHQQGLVKLGAADLSMLTGKAFEEEVKKSLENVQ